MRKDNNQMLRVQRLAARTTRPAPAAANANGLVIGSQFGPDGALYLARFSVGCCRVEHERRPTRPRSSRSPSTSRTSA